MREPFGVAVIAAALALAQPASAQMPAGTAFTYQGRLLDLICTIQVANLGLAASPATTVTDTLPGQVRGPAATEGELVHGTLLHGDLAAAGGSPDVDLYRIHQRPYASYEVLVDGTSGDIGPAGPTLQRLASDGSTVLQSSQAAGVGSNQSLRFFNATGSAVQGELIRVQSASCTLDCGPDDVYRLRTWETTVSIPRFNNSATQVTLLVLQNRGDGLVAGHLYFWNASGVLLHQQDLDLGAWGSLSLNTSTIPALQGQGGSITVAHDGRYGVIAGKAVAVEAATGFSFDSLLVARPR